jgi:hypothetical protein
VPVLVEELPRIGNRHLSPGCTLEHALLDRWAEDQTDRRSWKLSRSTAHRLVESRVESAAADAPNADLR